MSKKTNILSTIFHRNIFSRVPHKRIILVLELVIQISFQTCTIINKGFKKICCLEWKGREKNTSESNRRQAILTNSERTRSDVRSAAQCHVTSQCFGMQNRGDERASLVAYEGLSRVASKCRNTEIPARGTGEPTRCTDSNSHFVAFSSIIRDLPFSFTFCNIIFAIRM